eukprot:g3644.t1
MRIRKLGRTAAHRRALMRNMIDQLIKYERIQTTVPKAKQLRRVADRVVRYAKRGNDVHNRGLASKWIRTHDSLDKLFTELRPRYMPRSGGYTRIMRSNLRKGDAAPMCFIEFVDRPGEIRPARAPWRGEQAGTPDFLADTFAFDENSSNAFQEDTIIEESEVLDAESVTVDADAITVDTGAEIIDVDVDEKK